MTSPWGPHRDDTADAQPVDPYAGQAGPPLPIWTPAGPPAPFAPPANPYANPGSWEPARYLPRASVPGMLLAGTIVGYVFALLLFVSGLFLLFFGTVLPDSFDEADSTLGDGGVSLTVAGVGNWVAVALLVTAGVLCSVRRSAGAVVMVAAAALVVVLAIAWVVSYPDSGVVFWAVVHSLVGLLAAGLALVPPRNRAWLAGTDVVSPAHAGPAPFPTDAWGRPFGS